MRIVKILRIMYQYFKQTIILLSISIIISSCGGASNSHFYQYDRGDCKTNRFDEVDDNLDVYLQWKYDTLYLTWDQYSGDEFRSYYIVRDETETCPFYYSGRDYHEVISRKSQTYFKDESIVSGESYYYRVCVYETDRNIHCGGVKKVEIY